ncbi:hypothetical protein TELCIR_09246 [Teladorsagia circumcincta]|uniref:Collagen triple helix repeat protein n=1 Tax=Teladorsagia circumcincta TaxID=45464 RepID=A0A2G9UHH8_TELCI|nr:hypothetical protein TELCIR_09246 [Teladorsagia circumcincta]
MGVVCGKPNEFKPPVTTHAQNTEPSKELRLTLPGADGNPGAPGQAGQPGGPGEPGICPKYCAIDGGVFFEDGTRR